MFGKDILFFKIFENYFSENEIFENWSMAVGIWFFYAKFKDLELGCVLPKWNILYL